MRDLGIWRKPRAVNQFRNSHQDLALQLAGDLLRKEATEPKIEGEFTMQITVLNPLACSSRLAPAPLHYTAELETDLTYLVNTEQRLSFATC